MKPTAFFLALIAAAMLFAALIPGWPYGYFTLLRFAVTIASGTVFFWALEREVKWLLWIHGPLAILFNPLVKVHLDRDTWQMIDLIAGVVMIVTAVAVGRYRQPKTRI